MRRVTMIGLACLAAWLVLPSRSAWAIPAFAHRTGFSCQSCHEFHAPRLNAFGDLYRRNGYQLPGGAEEAVRARRMLEPGTIAERLSVFKELPFSLRLAAITELALEDHESPRYELRLNSMLSGGGPVARDVSAFFSWTPFPAPYLHQARIGLHNLWASRLGEGTLNVRAGLLLLLDFQRPVHRTLAPGPSPAGAVAVKRNPFMLDDASVGVELNGKPGFGPLSYQIDVVAGPPGAVADVDRWKDVFARVAYTFAQNTTHELSVASFGYLGWHQADLDIGGVTLVHMDKFWLAGGDLELDLGNLDVTALAYHSRHGDPGLDGAPVTFTAGRVEAAYALTPRWSASARVEIVFSDDHALEAQLGVAHLTWLLAPNVLATFAWRQDLTHASSAMGTAMIETIF